MELALPFHVYVCSGYLALSRLHPLLLARNSLEARGMRRRADGEVGLAMGRKRFL